MKNVDVLSNSLMDSLIAHLRKRIAEITDDYIQNPDSTSYTHTLSETLSDVVR